jgi:hypothetical protein
MKKNTIFFIAFFLTCASLTLFAQANICVTSSVTTCYTGCGANEFEKYATTTYSGVVRNTYNDGGSAVLYYTGSRWEILFAMADVDFYNEADTAPNPPGLSVGTWVSGGTCGTITAMTGGVQNAPLPIELTRFEGNKKESNNHLIWQTASESQNKGFDIERSTDGIRFQKIGFVAGKGSTNERQDYSFKDDASSRLVYYRLKQLDFDGNYEYSKIISIAQNGKNAVSIFPNPSNGVFSIVGVEELEDEQFTLINSIGQTLSISVQNDHQLDLSAYPLGVYYLRVASSGQVVRLVKE